MIIEGAERQDGAFEFRGLCDLEWVFSVESLGGGERYLATGRPGGAELPLVRAETKPAR